jgi:asparagine synthase (glutamine-hydrolysing)
MCGIVGVAIREGRGDREALIAMRDTMTHRGPDDAGAWWSSDGRMGLAHRRLAIIDLSSAGRQPMGDVTDGAWITYNGEIYNYRELKTHLEAKGYRFRTATDTEVILASYRTWGEQFVTHLNGMFALGLYDARARRLILARDRAGEKPLFYRIVEGRLVFASELKAMMADTTMPRIVDRSALQHYLAYGYVPGDACLLAGVRKLPPAHVATYDVDSGTLDVRSYWHLPVAEPEPTEQVETLVSELEDLLGDSVRRRLVADVPVGILLSGGIDSSLVTAMAARGSGRVKTFTISFPGHDEYDETEHARRVAKYFGTDHTEFVAEASIVELLPELARHYDEPLGDSSMVPTYLVSRLVREHATVALGGDGGDELFGGYLHHAWLQRQESFRRFAPRPFRLPAADWLARLLPAGFKGRNYFVGLGRDLPESIAQFNSFFDGPLRRRLLASARRAPLPDSSPEAYKLRLCRPGQTPLQAATAVDFQTYLPDDILVKVDRASMAASLEMRAPWLDHRLIEFAFARVPDALKATARERKILPRLLAARLLPPDLDLSRKQGFSLPLASWFRKEWGRYTEDVLSALDPSVFDPAAVRNLIRNQRRGYSNAQRLFALTMFELWRREYRVSLPP